MKKLLSATGKILYKMMGWTYDELPEYWEKKQVIIGFPHTTNMDTVRALTYIKIAGIDVGLLVKAEWFFWPMSVLLKGLGAIPVHRDKASGFVGSVVEELSQREELSLAMVPEGTRRDVAKIRTGFWHIARGAGVPIVCWYLDNAEKRTKWLGRIMPGDDMYEDLLKIRDIYGQAGFDIPLGSREYYM